MKQLWRVAVNISGTGELADYYVAGRNFAEASTPLSELRDEIVTIESMGRVYEYGDNVQKAKEPA